MYEPIIVFFIIDDLMVVCSPIEALGPIIECEMLQPSAILTGGIITLVPRA